MNVGNCLLNTSLQISQYSQILAIQPMIVYSSILNIHMLRCIHVEQLGLLHNAVTFLIQSAQFSWENPSWKTPHVCMCKQPMTLACLLTFILALKVTHNW